MKILVTGANGFVGRNLVKKLDGHDVVGITRKEVDLCNSDAVSDFFKNKTFNVVIHAAVCGGKRLEEEGPEVVDNNLKMFYNLMTESGKYDRLINIGSGAELDRRYDINKNSRLLYRFPIDPYGMSKNIIARICVGAYNLTNVRGFGIFGEDESLDRFIRSNVIRAIKNEDIIVHQNKLMDFFYIDDLVTLIDEIIDADYSPSYVDCSYDRVFTLVEIANLIIKICKSSSKIRLDKSELSNDYCGQMYPISDNTLDFIGLEEGIKRIYLNEKD